jgi:hypothetical protein
MSDIKSVYVDDMKTDARGATDITLQILKGSDGGV